MSELNLTQAQVEEIEEAVDDFNEYCTKKTCDECPLEDVACESTFYKIKLSVFKVPKKKPYTPTRLDYFVARIASGVLADATSDVSREWIVSYAKELIKEIDKQEIDKQEIDKQEGEK